MKKNFFLTLMLAVLCTATSWAQFNPEQGKAYALKFQNYDLYVDVQTKGHADHSDANCISASISPTAVYFEEGTDGKWKMKNANDEYIGIGLNFWNAAIGRETQWTIVAEESVITISGSNGYIGVDTPKDGGILYSNTSKNYKFEVLDYNELTQTATSVYTTFKAVKMAKDTHDYDTYLSTIPVSASAVSFQREATKFRLLQMGDAYCIVLKDSEPTQYLAQVENAGDVWSPSITTTPYLWLVSDEDGDGDFIISKKSYSEHRLGSDARTIAGTGIFANVGSECNEWIIENHEEASLYTFIIDSPSELEVIVKYNGEQILGGAQLPANADETLFTVPEIAGHTWEIVFDHYNKTITLLYVKKYSLHLPNAPLGVTVKYNGNDITEGYFFENGFDSQYLTVEGCPDGYSWQISKDTAGKFIIITFTKQEAVENPAAVVALIKRIGGEAAADKFKFVLDPSLKNENNDETNENNDEIFVIDSDHHKVRIQGNTISAITTGLGWYLQNHAHINIAWNSLNEKSAGEAYADLSNIPVPTTAETHTTDAKYRYYLNYCTFGYSMTTWTWKRWQQEIDWMALHGINMPLQIVGLEEVWRKFLTLEEKGQRKYNYTDAEAMAFVPGPAFTAWWGMNNLEGWGGTAANGWGGVQDKAWYARQQQLATQILDRQRELGMQPVLPGFSGMVPSDFQTKTGVVCDAGGWCGFTRPKIVLPSNERFAEIAADYYKCLAEVMGESQYYSIDPFHEGGSINGGTEQQYKDAYKAIYDAMEAAKPASQWVIQQWQWSHNNFQKYSLTAVPAGRLIVLDLFSDGRPEFDLYSGYAPQEAVFCAVPNFGGRSGLMGRLNNVAENYFEYKEKYPTSIKGIAAAPEAIEQTPIAYDLVFQLPWMGTKPDVKEWVKNYSVARYGVANAELQAAWELLRQGPLNYGADAIQGPVEDVWAAIPNLNANPASAWGSTLSKPHGNNPRPDETYTKERQQMLIDATYKLLGQAGAVSGDVNVSNYNYDVVELGGGVFADYAHHLLLGIKEARDNSNDALFESRRDAFLALIADVDEFKGTNLNFRLGKWTQEARDAAAEAVALGATAANADWYEYNNARTLITTWGDEAQSINGQLRDYSYRSWQGLMKDVYLPRWQHYFANDCSTSSNYFFFSWNWAHGMKHSPTDASKSAEKLASTDAGYSYSRTPVGNTVDVAKAKLAKYIIPVLTANGTVYAYRHLENDLKESVRLTVEEGCTVNLCDYFAASLANATITAEGCIEGTVTDATSVTIKAGAANGEATEYDANITLADGTVIDFVLVAHSEVIATAKEGLAAIIAQMESLTAQVATYKPTDKETEITLTTTQGSAFYVSTNADQNTGGGRNDGGGIAALVDNNEGTYFHTRWGGTVVSEPHYIQVDLGADNLMDNFKFTYKPRSGSPAPTAMKVYGSNDGVNFTDVLATINSGLPAHNSGSTYESAAIDSKRYRYLRFTVTRSAGPGNVQYGGQYFFGMLEFDLLKVSSSADVNTQYESKIEDEEAAAYYDDLLYAIKIYNNSISQSEIDAAKIFLQGRYEALITQLGGNLLPVRLTVDEANPVLYNIQVNRTYYSPTLLGYNAENGLVYIERKTDNNIWQAWYFMLGENGILIKPFNGDGKVLGADNNDNGTSKVWAVENGTKNICEWTIEHYSGDWYNILGNGKCFSNNGGNHSNTMGFYDVKNDDGSKFKFVEAEFTNGNARYYQLQHLVNNVIPTQDDAKLNQMASGTAPGYYTGNADEFRDAYRAAKTLTNASAPADCYATYKALREAYATYGEMRMIMPTPGAVYRIRNYIIDDEVSIKNHYIAVNNEVEIELPASVSENNQGAMWVCIKDGDNYKFVSALGTAAFGWNVNMTETIDVLRENSIAYRIDAGGEPGSLRIAAHHTDNFYYALALTSEEWKSRGKPLFNRGKDAHGQYDKWSVDWYLEPVENVDIAFNRDLAAGHKWGTLYLPYAVEVPEGITAYYATSVNAGEKVIELTEVRDIIPAYTPVLINRSEDGVTETFPFYYTTQAGTAVDGNLFAGRIMESVVECENNKKYYLLLNAGKGEAFYWVYKEYDADGKLYPGQDKTHIKCEANKAYLALDGTNPAALSFRYSGGTTGVDELKTENGEVEAVYDLQGRKVVNPKKGLYIIDGKKVLVK